ncbi:hypothetical protein OROGR_006086 [Orobanche gracilis]
MNSTSTQFVPARWMGIYEPIHHMSMWEDFKGKTCLDESPPSILDVDTKPDNQSDDTSNGTVGPSNKYDQEASKPDNSGTVDRFTAFRLRFVIITNRKLPVLRRLAQNREAARKSRLRKKAIAAFEMEYEHWVEELNRQISILGNALRSNNGAMLMRIVLGQICGANKIW